MVRINKQILYYFLVIFLLITCKKKDEEVQPKILKEILPEIPSDFQPKVVIKERIIGTWEWDYSWRQNDTTIYDSTFTGRTWSYTFQDDDSVIIKIKYDSSATIRRITHYFIGKPNDFWTGEAKDGIYIADTFFNYNPYTPHFITFKGSTMTLLRAIPPGDYFENYVKKK